MATHRKIGIKDVAREADVALSTVSHVLNGSAPISAEVRSRVLETAKRLGYLAHRKEKATIAALGAVLLAVVEDARPENEINLFSWTILSALARDCERRGVKLVPFSEPGALQADKIIAAARKSSVDGIIIVHDDRPELLAAIGACGIPAILVNGEDMAMQIDSVTPGNRFAAQFATNWLIARGHKRILHLTWGGRTTIQRRVDGFRDAFSARALPQSDALVLDAGGYEPRFGEAAMTRWIADKGGLDGVTALFCAADNLAIGAMRALTRAGFGIPRDISVMGFDGVSLGELTSPPLTTMTAPLEHIGPASLNLLEQRVALQDAKRPAHRLELGCRIVERESAAAI